MKRFAVVAGAIVAALAIAAALANVASSDQPAAHPPTDADEPSCVPIGSPVVTSGPVGCVLKADDGKNPRNVYDREGGKVVGYFGLDRMQYVSKDIADKYGLDAVAECHTANYDSDELSLLCVEMLRAEGWPEEHLRNHKALKSNVTPRTSPSSG